MAHPNIKLMGAVYSSVPAVQLPQSPSGTATFYDVADTTAAASDVASGKYFYTASGVYTQGTASGGGGGASNIVQGTFTTGATRNSKGTVSIPYSGSGYPIAVFVYIDGGPYNNTSGGNTTWYNSLNRYDCGFYSMVKSEVNTTPTYAGTGTNNYGTVTVIYKNSTSSATSYTRTSAMTANAYTAAANTAAGSTQMVKFKGNGTTISYFIGNLGSGSIGFPPSTTMAYIVIYSS